MNTTRAEPRLRLHRSGFFSVQVTATGSWKNVSAQAAEVRCCGAHGMLPPHTYSRYAGIRADQSGGLVCPDPAFRTSGCVFVVCDTTFERSRAEDRSPCAEDRDPGAPAVKRRAPFMRMIVTYLLCNELLCFWPLPLFRWLQEGGRRTATLKTTYHDAEIRIGEGRTGNKFVLRRVAADRAQQ